ncbi:MAG: ATP phosphoribosyltransferase regulatory subunit [Clostridia bacterium]|nr:ATP phosphoribosyltransferase regulatory subunit [Clostridia bacterium]
MNLSQTVISGVESAVFTLRELYGRYGYTPYKMNKFEEYDLYVRNKDFLISDSIITFTDTNGKLMALKPDVTLSIVKNSRDSEGVQKVYYNENVYRVSEGTHAFREIMQAGIECIGDVDEYCLYEVLKLAAESLQSIAADWVLNISHLGVVSAVLEALSVPEAVYGDVFRAIGEKNLHELTALCNQYGIDGEKLGQLITVYGAPSAVLPQLRVLLGECEALAQLERVMAVFVGTPFESHLRIDFSVISNTKYYNGFTFKGFVQGVPDSVLSGGQYDNLMRKIGRRDGAVGFAVYLDMLEQLHAPMSDDADGILLYGDEDIATVSRAVETLTAEGARVIAARVLPPKCRAKHIWKLEQGEVKRVENDA